MTPKIHKIALNVRATAEEKAAKFSGFRRSYPTNPKIPIERPYLKMGRSENKSERANLSF